MSRVIQGQSSLICQIFDTLNHTILLNLQKTGKKMRGHTDGKSGTWKSGVMENGVVTETERGSPQGGNLSHY